MIEIHKSLKINEGDYILTQYYRYGKEISVFELMRVLSVSVLKKIKVRKKQCGTMKAKTMFNHAKRGVIVNCQRIVSNPHRIMGITYTHIFTFPKKRFRLTNSAKYFLLTEDEARLYLL